MRVREERFESVDPILERSTWENGKPFNPRWISILCRGSHRAAWDGRMAERGWIDGTDRPADGTKRRTDGRERMD